MSQNPPKKAPPGCVIGCFVVLIVVTGMSLFIGGVSKTEWLVWPLNKFMSYDAISVLGAIVAGGTLLLALIISLLQLLLETASVADEYFSTPEGKEKGKRIVRRIVENFEKNRGNE